MSAILQDLVTLAGELARTDLVTGAGGNLSAREGDEIWVSPSGMSFGDAKPDDYASVRLADGSVSRGVRRPSSELPMHLAIHRARPEVRFVVHTHPKTTIALCSSGHDLKPMYPDYYVFLGANVPHLPYVTVSTQALADAVGAAASSSDCFGLILRNHGAITVGRSYREALFRMLAIEEQALIQWRALQVGKPAFLSDEECRKLDQLDSEEYRRRLVSGTRRQQG